MRTGVISAIWVLNFSAFIIAVEFLRLGMVVSIWFVYIISFFASSMFYAKKYTSKKEYIPKFDVIISLSFTALSLALLALFGEYRDEGWLYFGGAAYRPYTLVVAIFSGFLLVLNLIIYFIKMTEERKCNKKK